jgi:D-alanyl-D-alanine carboxypeptidase (penicillin-binding protein 5/6)
VTLLYAFLVKSANDVANVLARDNAGSISAFAAKMNAKARSLGCSSTNFKNPHGLTARAVFHRA